MQLKLGHEPHLCQPRDAFKPSSYITENKTQSCCIVPRMVLSEGTRMGIIVLTQFRELFL